MTNDSCRKLNKWSRLLNVEQPECKGTGHCCRYASPSTPAKGLLKKASEGDEFAREFLSIFVPYSSIEEVERLNPSTVEKVLRVCGKPESKVSVDELNFYHCRFLSDENRCLIYEDRPQLCRDYPDNPFLALHPGCAFETWAKECRAKFADLKSELGRLKEKKAELESLKCQQRFIRLNSYVQKVDSNKKFIVLFPDFCLVSPAKSWLYPYIRKTMGD